MRLSHYLLPTQKETPSDATVASHRLMLRAGLVRPAATGIYSWLPLGYRVLRNIEAIIREEQNNAGALEVLLPTIQSAELWKQSGRYDVYGPEMLKITDRNQRDLLYGPTAEEQITDLFRHTVQTYRDLPKILYQIQWKFRDEIRPRFGVLRAREFLMKDGYSFDLTADAAQASYNRMFIAYLRSFARLGLKAIPFRAASGPIGGERSHEFLVLADHGESEVQYHRDLLELPAPDPNIDYGADLGPIVDQWTRLYAATDERYDQRLAPQLGSSLLTARGIEVGHIFYFGTKYSSALGAVVTSPSGSEVPVEMGSYGIGISRLVGAIIEASHDHAGIIWPEPVAPFRVHLLNLKTGHAACDRVAEQIYSQLASTGTAILYDDRDLRAGTKHAEADLIGLPWQIILGPNGIADGRLEIKNRKTGKLEEMTPDSAVARFTADLKPRIVAA